MIEINRREDTYPSIFYDNFDSILAFKKYMQSKNLEWLQLDHGQFNSEITQINTETIQLCKYSYSRQFEISGESPKDSLTIWQINSHNCACWRGNHLEPSNLIVFPQSTQFEIVSQPNFKGHMLSVDNNFFIAKANQLGLRYADQIVGKEQGLLISPEIQSSFLFNLIATNLEFIKHNPLIIKQNKFRDQIHSLIVDNLLITLDCSKEKCRRQISINREKVVKRAKSFIKEFEGEFITISTLCEAANVSWRTLDYSFKSLIGVTPKQYLQAYRFNKARIALLEASKNHKIADIANKLGFWHIGQFSSDYRKYFGELPSQTLNLYSP